LETSLENDAIERRRRRAFAKPSRWSLLNKTFLSCPYVIS
jgi:hypothetical protein